MDIYNVKQCLS